MRKLTLALLGASTALALCAGAGTAKADYTATIFDAREYNQTLNTPYSHGYDTRVTQNGQHWFDNVSGTGNVSPGTGELAIPPFWSTGASVTWSGNDVTIKLFTNMPAKGDSGYGMADVFFDLGGNGSFDYGLDINSGSGSDGYGGPGTLYASGGTQGKLYENPTFATSASFGQIALTAVCSDTGGGANNCSGGRPPETEVTGGTLVPGLIAITQTILDTTPNGTPTDQPFYEYSFTVSGLNASGAWDTLRLFWGTGQCGNDTVEGTVTRVPVPAALPIFAAAMAGFGFAGWRRRKPAA